MRTRCVLVRLLYDDMQRYLRVMNADEIIVPEPSRCAEDLCKGRERENEGKQSREHALRALTIRSHIC